MAVEYLLNHCDWPVGQKPEERDRGHWFRESGKPPTEPTSTILLASWVGVGLRSLESSGVDLLALDWGDYCNYAPKMP